jgi:hypothetical protein
MSSDSTIVALAIEVVIAAPILAFAWCLERRLERRDGS